MSLFNLLPLLVLLAGCSTTDGGSPLGAPEDNNADPPKGTNISQILDGLPTPTGFNTDLDGTFLNLDTFPFEDMFGGGPGKDGIPALNNPNFVGPDQAFYLADEDLVLGMVVNGQVKAYPHNIGWYHEIVNDRIGGYPISVTFCPLTGTGLAFDAEDELGRQFELGGSGLIFNTNLVMYDRRDNNTLYPQIAFIGVQGTRRGEALTLLPIVETTWETWKRLYPDTEVLSGGTGYSHNYRRYPYGKYRTDNQFFLFPLSTKLDNNGNLYAATFKTKELVLGVRLNNEARAYPHSVMGERIVINEELGGVPIVVLWDRVAYLAIPYARRTSEGQVLTFEIDEIQGFPFSLRDQETNTLWDVKGTAIEGPLAGQRLQQIPAHNSMWFAWVTFWQNTTAWMP